MITWFVSGHDTNFDSLGGTPFGSFTTSSGSSSGGNGTNKFTTFGIAKQHLVEQNSTAAPTADPLTLYDITPTTVLASNRTATSITVTLPTSAVSNLTQNPLRPEQFYLFDSKTNLATFDATFPAGTYTFNVTGSSNQTTPVNLSASLVQPNAPHISNFTAAQNVNPAQPFVLSWDAFSGGTATDYIQVSIGSVFTTTNLGVPGALTGTSTSVTIPANTLQANSNYNGSIGFYRTQLTSNAAFSTLAYVASTTYFTLATSSGSASVTLVLTNAAWTGNTFGFDVLAPSGQTLTVEYSSTLRSNSWATVLTTNAPAGGRLHVAVPHSTTNRSLAYRARTGS